MNCADSSACLRRWLLREEEEEAGGKGGVTWCNSLLTALPFCFWQSNTAVGYNMAPMCRPTWPNFPLEIRRGGEGREGGREKIIEFNLKKKKKKMIGQMQPIIDTLARDWLKSCLPGGRRPPPNWPDLNRLTGVNWIQTVGEMSRLDSVHQQRPLGSEGGA